MSIDRRTDRGEAAPTYTERHLATGRDVLPFATTRMARGGRRRDSHTLCSAGTGPSGAQGAADQDGPAVPAQARPRGERHRGLCSWCLACPGWSSPSVGPALVPPWVTTPQALSGGLPRPSDTWAWRGSLPKAARQCHVTPGVYLQCDPQGGGTSSSAVGHPGRRGQRPVCELGCLCPQQWAGGSSPSASWAPGRAVVPVLPV